jgi:hypothetical protein
MEDVRKKRGDPAPATGVIAAAVFALEIGPALSSARTCLTLAWPSTPPGC